MTDYTFNNESYSLEILIGKIQNDQYVDLIDINFDFISSLKLINDINQPLTRIELIAKDQNGTNLSKYKKGNSIILVKIKNNTFNIDYEEHFILTQISMMSYQIEEVIYKLQGTSIILPIWITSLNYSTNNEEKPVTEIIEDIMKNSKLPYKQSSNIEHTDIKMNYITPINETIQNNIKYLLNMAISKDAGIYYCPWDFYEKNFYLLSIKKLFESYDPTQVKSYEYVIIPSTGGTGETENIPRGLKYNNYFSSNFEYILSQKNIIHSFDYNSKKWSKDEYDFNNTKKIIPTSNKIFYEPSILEVPSFIKKESGNLFQDERIPRSKIKFTSQLLDYINYSEVIQFDIFGYFKRDVGKLMTVEIKDLESPLVYKFNGPWMISRVYSTFRKWSFDQNISLVRFEHLSQNS